MKCARSRHSFGRAVIAAVVVALAAAGGNAATQAREYTHWYASHGELLDQGQSITLDGGNHRLALRSGWTCTVGELLPVPQPDSQARLTSCEKGDEALEFSVQCELPERAKDHTQIRFRSSDGRMSDFVEVGCEVRSR